jgi:7-cyano-7-deazaguanine synthase
LTIDYGQLPAAGEIRAARAICDLLGIEHHVLAIDCSQLGSGLLAGRSPDPRAPVEEWWPYRNQLLITLAAAWALPRGFEELIVGSVSDDAGHRDGTVEFYDLAHRLVAMQEGGLNVRAPALDRQSSALVRGSELPEGVIGLTHSCHSSDFACGLCPGCLKREAVIAEMRSRG